MSQADRIAAIATPPGRGAIGVVRVSGPSLPALFRPLLGRTDLAPRHATFTAFLDQDGQPIDEGLAIFFPAPHSYTGEDVLELQGHGGPAVLALVLRRCLDLGARMAEPGEFTKRAYLNDRLDLVQAEAVADVIQAGSEAAARSAVRALDGAFSREINELASQITRLRVLVEACIDFPEEDVELLTRRGGLDYLGQIRARLGLVLTAARSGRLLQEGAKVVLCGRPNVGKSTLLNRLAEADVAIVTDVPGTTRDPLRETIQIDGVPLQIIDTAGLREASDPVEKLGVDRTWQSIEAADLAILMCDAQSGLTDQDEEIRAALPVSLPVITVANKADLVSTAASRGGLSISARRGDGLDELKARILATLGWQPAEAGIFAARERHLQALREAEHEIEGASAHVVDLELFAEHLRQAHAALGAITGQVSSDDLLGEIFQSFCIGK